MENFDQFIKSSKPVIQSISREFDRKKKAKILEKTRSKDIGSLNLSRLPYHKITDNIFKTVEISPSGKNHAYFILVDFSSSMREVIVSVLKQAWILSEFLNSVKVQYHIVSFTSSYDQEIKMNLLLSSDYTKMENLFRFKEMFEIFSYGKKPTTGKFNKMDAYSLCGTPLDKALVVSLNCMMEMKKTHNIEFMNFITITDGCGTNRGDMNCVVSPFNGKRYDASNYAKYDRNYRISAMLLDVIRDHKIAVHGFFISPGQFYEHTKFDRASIHIGTQLQNDFIMYIHKSIEKNYHENVNGYDTYMILGQYHLNLGDKDFQYKKNLAKYFSACVLKNI